MSQIEDFEYDEYEADIGECNYCGRAMTIIDDPLVVMEDGIKVFYCDKQCLERQNDISSNRT